MHPQKIAPLSPAADEGVSCKNMKMNNFKDIPKVILANVAFFIYMIIALIGVIFRHSSAEWENMKNVRLEYDLLFGLGLSILSTLAIAGLLLRKEWGRQFSIAFCSILFFTNFILRLSVYIYFKYFKNVDVMVIDPDAIVISILSLLFLVLLTRNKTKKLFNIEDR